MIITVIMFIIKSKHILVWSYILRFFSQGNLNEITLSQNRILYEKIIDFLLNSKSRNLKRNFTRVKNITFLWNLKKLSIFSEFLLKTKLGSESDLTLLRLKKKSVEVNSWLYFIYQNKVKAMTLTCLYFLTLGTNLFKTILDLFKCLY